MANSVASDVAFKVDSPERIPSIRYYDEGFHKLETERLRPKALQRACRLEQIQKIGDWVGYSSLGKSIIVVCTRSV